MTTLVLSGSRHDVLLSHLAIFGLAGILEDAGIPELSVSWTRGMNPRPSVRFADEIPDVEAARVVMQHAQHHTLKGSLAQQTQDPDLSAQQTRFSDQTAWQNHQRQRHEVLQRLTDERRVLDLRLLLGLGEPAHWRIGDRFGNQDQGASRLQMTPRNQGSTLFKTRLSQLAGPVANATTESILRRLRGQELRDDLWERDTKRKKLSATGLGPITETDNVLVWCALWGLAWLPVAPQSQGWSLTSAIADVRNQTVTTVLPVWHTLWTTARCRSVLASRQLVKAWGAGSGGEPEASAAAAWLLARGIQGVVVFVIRDVGTGQAALRMTTPGTVSRLAGAR